jgi:hypothetical protein
MIDQSKQGSRTEAQHLIAAAQAARVQAHVRAMLSRLNARRAKFLRAA